MCTGKRRDSISVFQNVVRQIPKIKRLRNFYIPSFEEDRIWRFSHNYFSFDPMQGDFDVAGLQYQWNDGIFSITLGRRNSDGFRSVFFHPMAR